MLDQRQKLLVRDRGVRHDSSEMISRQDKKCNKGVHRGIRQYQDPVSVPQAQPLFHLPEILYVAQKDAE